MPKPPALQPGEKTKTFMVKHGHMIADNDGIMRIGKGTLPAKDDVPGNDLIELSYEQAKYYRNLDKMILEAHAEHKHLIGFSEWIAHVAGHNT